MSNKWEVIKHTIEQRRSVFPPAYNNQVVPKEIISQILEAANWAPTHKLIQPWRFIVLLGKARLRLGKALLQHYDQSTPENHRLEKKRQKLIRNPLKASALIGICMQPDPAGKVPEWEDLAATACAVENMWLAATALGVSGYWSTPNAMEVLQEFFNLTEGQKCLGLFYLGYSDETPQIPNRTMWQEKVSWVED